MMTKNVVSNNLICSKRNKEPLSLLDCKRDSSEKNLVKEFHLIDKFTNT